MTSEVPSAERIAEIRARHAQDEDILADSWGPHRPLTHTDRGDLLAALDAANEKLARVGALAEWWESDPRPDAPEGTYTATEAAVEAACAAELRAVLDGGE